jgi:O-antigen/teichoic acid export membrane protein
MVFQFLYIRYVSYYVDKNIYGNFILLQTLIIALSYIFLQIPSQAYDRFYNEAKNKIEYINEFRTLLIFINILSFFIIILYGYMMKKFSFKILIIIFIYFILLNNFSFNQKIFLLNLERKKYFYLKILEGFSKFIMPIIFYYFFPSLISFLIGIVIGYFLSFLFLIKFLKNYPFYLSINWEHYKKYFLFAYPIIFVSIFSWGISFSDRYFIEYLSGTKNVAIYSILAQVAGFGQIIGQIYNIYVNPKVLKIYSENNKIGFQYLNKMLKFLLLVFIVLTFIAYIIPLNIYSILIEKKLLEQPYYFWTFFILIVGIFLTIFQTAISMHFILTKKLHILAYLNGIAFFMNIIGNFFIKEFGIIAAAISTLVAYMVLNLGQIFYLRKNIIK